MEKIGDGEDYLVYSIFLVLNVGKLFMLYLLKPQAQVNALKVVLLVEWDNPKDETRNKKRLKHGSEVGTPYYEKKREEGIKWEMSGWSDNTGHMIGWHEFETVEDFAKIWNDEEFQ